MLLLLFQTHDFWFCSCINASTYSMLGLLLGDTRALAPLAAWAGVQLNIMIDVNICGAKVWVILNVVGVINCLATWVALSHGLVDGVREFSLFRHKSRELPASAFVMSGLLTTAALVARNAYRKRLVFQKRADRLVIECVCYRVDLRFKASRSTDTMLFGAGSIAPTAPGRTCSSRPEFEKTFAYVKQIGMIDAHLTLLPTVGSTDECNVSAHRATAFACFGVATPLASLCSWFGDVYVSTECHALVVRVCALVITLAWCSACAAHYRRKLLAELYCTFEVLFLFFHLLVVHVSVCLVFAPDRVGQDCVVVLVSWLWFVWVLRIDALPPVQRTRLGVRGSFVVAVTLSLLAVSVALVRSSVFADAESVRFRDVVLWEGRIAG